RRGGCAVIAGVTDQRRTGKARQREWHLIAATQPIVLTDHFLLLIGSKDRLKNILLLPPMIREHLIAFFIKLCKDSWNSLVHKTSQLTDTLTLLCWEVTLLRI